jgi:hypothetical protein
MKFCTKCQIKKPKADFGAQASRKDGLRCWCKTCHNATNKAWRNNNNAYYKLRYANNPELRKPYDAKYRSKNPNYLKEYYESNKHEFIGRVAKRRKKTKLASPLWVDEKKMRLYYRISTNLNALYGYVKYHVDHIVPLQGKLVSGLHVHNNLKILLAEENKAKFNKWKS